MEKRDWRFYWKLFRATFTLSAFTFGGGFVIIPLMRRKFVEQYHWIEEQEMLDLTAIAQSSPGAIAVNASILVGYRLAGLRGSAVTILATILPPLIIITVISMFYTAFRDSVLFNTLLKGMRCGVAAVILDVVLTMGKDILKKRQILAIAIMVCAFIATWFFKVNVIFIILVCGILGMASALYREHKDKGGKTACS